MKSFILLLAPVHDAYFEMAKVLKRTGYANPVVTPLDGKAGCRRYRISDGEAWAEHKPPSSEKHSKVVSRQNGRSRKT